MKLTDFTTAPNASRAASSNAAGKDGKKEAKASADQAKQFDNAVQNESKGGNQEAGDARRSVPRQRRPRTNSQNTSRSGDSRQPDTAKPTENGAKSIEAQGDANQDVTRTVVRRNIEDVSLNATAENSKPSAEAKAEKAPQKSAGSPAADSSARQAQGGDADAGARAGNRASAGYSAGAGRALARSAQRRGVDWNSAQAKPFARMMNMSNAGLTRLVRSAVGSESGQLGKLPVKVEVFSADANSVDGTGGTVEALTADGKIYISDKLLASAQKGNPAGVAALGSAMREELAEAAYQQQIGSLSKGDFGGEAVARRDGSFNTLSADEKTALLEETDVATITNSDGKEVKGETKTTWTVTFYARLVNGKVNGKNGEHYIPASRGIPALANAKFLGPVDRIIQAKVNFNPATYKGQFNGVDRSQIIKLKVLPKNWRATEQNFAAKKTTYQQKLFISWKKNPAPKPKLVTRTYVAQLKNGVYVQGSVKSKSPAYLVKVKTTQKKGKLRTKKSDIGKNGNTATRLYKVTFTGVKNADGSYSSAPKNTKKTKYTVTAEVTANRRAKNGKFKGGKVGATYVVSAKKVLSKKFNAKPKGVTKIPPASRAGNIRPKAKPKSVKMKTVTFIAQLKNGKYVAGSVKNKGASYLVTGQVPKSKKSGFSIIRSKAKKAVKLRAVKFTATRTSGGFRVTGPKTNKIFAVNAEVEPRLLDKKGKLKLGTVISSKFITKSKKVATGGKAALGFAVGVAIAEGSARAVEGGAANGLSRGGKGKRKSTKKGKSGSSKNKKNEKKKNEKKKNEKNKKNEKKKNNRKKNGRTKSAPSKVSFSDIGVNTSRLKAIKKKFKLTTAEATDAILSMGKAFFDLGKKSPMRVISQGFKNMKSGTRNKLLKQFSKYSSTVQKNWGPLSKGAGSLGTQVYNQMKKALSKFGKKKGKGATLADYTLDLDRGSPLQFISVPARTTDTSGFAADKDGVKLASVLNDVNVKDIVSHAHDVLSDKKHADAFFTSVFGTDHTQAQRKELTVMFGKLNKAMESGSISAADAKELSKELGFNFGQFGSAGMDVDGYYQASTKNLGVSDALIGTAGGTGIEGRWLSRAMGEELVHAFADKVGLSHGNGAEDKGRAAMNYWIHSMTEKKGELDDIPDIDLVRKYNGADQDDTVLIEGEPAKAKFTSGVWSDNFVMAQFRGDLKGFGQNGFGLVEARFNMANVTGSATPNKGTRIDISNIADEFRRKGKNLKWNLNVIMGSAAPASKKFKDTILDAAGNDTRVALLWNMRGGKSRVNSGSISLLGNVTLPLLKELLKKVNWNAKKEKQRPSKKAKGKSPRASTAVVNTFLEKNFGVSTMAMASWGLNFGLRNSTLSHAIYFDRQYVQGAIGVGLKTGEEKKDGREAGGKIQVVIRANVAKFIGYSKDGKTIKGREIAGD